MAAGITQVDNRSDNDDFFLYISILIFSGVDSIFSIKNRQNVKMVNRLKISRLDIDLYICIIVLVFVQGTTIIASTSTNGAGGGQLIFGCSDGSLCVVNRDYEANHFRAFDVGLQLLAHSSGDTLIAIGVG